MADYKSSGATPRAWFPAAWKYYDGAIATFALILMLINTLVSVDVFNQTVERWISVGIAAVSAAAIWLKLRATQLGVVIVAPEQAQTTTAPKVINPPPDDQGGEHRKPESPPDAGAPQNH
jgi:hypothetical protein